ncbi:putative polyprenol reductase KNAG_0D01650 [Huiozyma naganishii CBS 8797]|uniref:Polyprenal reductase n=1 Tax=Huiozyma naganishii (strain ATCC MYA-139 / BCRC 22969 / CBS 8797 / KCTC 17520 / NBRC 10181 / NCYC 3082 / Yp74L-3) TaxID=1071383 RepID=J7RXT5_HUIN7|nr:hypothetical protein KNAG_0D01650 [Kazachstania naganishii CBS 8797]CCK69917.1 hypothetical protein KNAG_0D01650 [Kazachstania naganishii CBS 8797]
MIDLLFKFAKYFLPSTCILGLVCIVVAKLQLPDFLEYGKTLRNHDNNENSGVLELLAHFTLPKSLFSHFYVISFAFSLFEVIVYPNQDLVWILMAHSLRRLYETLFVCKYNENSRMNWSHYAVGIWFYSSLHVVTITKLYQNDISEKISPIITVIFCLASADQYRNHVILSNLIKYSLPKRGLFRYTCCPHYLDEIVIYASLTAINIDYAWLLIWVVISLSVSATETREYYLHKFKDEPVPSSAIIPFIW